MSTTDKREEINNYIKEADNRFILLVYGMMKEDKKNIVAYTAEGKPLTQEQYKSEIDEAREQYQTS